MQDTKRTRQPDDPPTRDTAHGGDARAYVYRQAAKVIRPRETRGHLPDLAEYVDLATLQAAVASNFPTLDSVRWFVRRHRDALAENGAVIVLAGRMRFHPGRFKQAAVQIGQRAAA